MITPETAVSPLDAFKSAVETRQQELKFLAEQLEIGLQLVTDPDQVNAIISESDRPELTLDAPAEQIQISFPYDTLRINNFIPNMRAFGPRVYRESTDFMTGEPKMVTNGRRQPTSEELALYRFMGARGAYDEHFAYAEENGIDREIAQDMLMQTHIGKESFMRMWLTLPRLTEKLMSSCLDDRSNPNQSIHEEIFVAYSIMSKLVDKNDTYVTKSDDTIDDWSLCR